MNPFFIEDVVPNRLVSEYANRTRYSGGVAGLGQCLPARRSRCGLGNIGAAEEGFIGPEYRPDELPKVDASKWYDSAGNLKEKEDDSPGFWSSFTDAASKAFTDVFNKPRQGGYLSPPVKESSPWPWVVGGVAVLGIGAFVLTRGKK